jgi:hypothetical protein
MSEVKIGRNGDFGFVLEGGDLEIRIYRLTRCDESI